MPLDLSKITVFLILVICQSHVQSIREVHDKVELQLPDPRENSVDSLDQKNSIGLNALKRLIKALIRFNSMDKPSKTSLILHDIKSTKSNPNERVTFSDLFKSSSLLEKGNQLSQTSTISFLEEEEEKDHSLHTSAAPLVKVEDPLVHLSTTQLESDKSHKFTHSFRFGYGTTD